MLVLEPDQLPPDQALFLDFSTVANMKTTNDVNDVRTFEGAGASLLFQDKHGSRNRMIFAMRNPDYVKNEKNLDECEYPGGKVDEDDYLKTSTDEEAVLYAVKREWDEEVFSVLEGNNGLRKTGNEFFSDFLTKENQVIPDDNCNFVDVQGGKSTIRFFLPEIDLNLKINDGRDMLYNLLELSDKLLEQRYQQDKTQTPLRGIVSADLFEVAMCIKNISRDIKELEKELKGGKLMKAIGPHCLNNKVTFTKLSTGETFERAIRKFNFFTLRAMFDKMGLFAKARLQ